MKTTRLTFEQFPDLLKHISNPPKFLDCAGALPPGEDYKYLCVIGSRHPSEYGLETCRALIKGLRDYPIVIVSGLAIGIDSAAHKAALEAKMKTISFPGSGLQRSVIYPASHLYLADRIIESGGTLLSAFEKGQLGAYWTFPSRNRLMAGCSNATLIIEGRSGSGTLLTAEYAIEFNRDVLIVPGSIFSDLSFGPHKLYKQGATPVTTPKEILKMLGFDVDIEKDVQFNINGTITEIIKKDKPKWGEARKIKANDVTGRDTINCSNSVNSGDSKNFRISPNSPKRQPPLLLIKQTSLPLSELSLSDEEMLIIKTLQITSLSSSDLINKTGLNASQINIILSELELCGLVGQTGGIYNII
jgi:DNA protecting protein DprA